MFQVIKKCLELVPPQLKGRLVRLQLLLLISSIVELLGVVSIGPFIALATRPEYVFDNAILFSVYQFLGEPEQWVFLSYIGLVFSSLFIISNGLILITQMKVVSISEKLQAFFSTELLDYYLSRGFLEHQSKHSSALMATVNSDVKRFCVGVFLSLLQINARLLSACVLIVLLFVVNATAAVIISSTLILLYFFIFSVTNKELKSNGKLVTEANKERVRVLYDGFEGVKYIKFFKLQYIFVNRLQSVYEKIVVLNVRDKLLRDIPYFFIEAVAFVLIVGVVVMMFAQGEGVSEALASLSVLCLAGYKLIPKFQQIYRALAAFKRNQTVVDSIYYELKGAKHTISDWRGAPINAGNIEAVNVLSAESICFSYPETSEIVFDGLNLSVKPGEVVGLIGESGAGKSTLMLIMSGLIQPDEGSVSYGVNQTAQDLDWHKVVGFVDSHTYVFEASLKDNVTLFEASVDEGWLLEVIELAGLTEVVNSLDNGADSAIGNKGGRLSSGQLQRVGFARALYKRPKVLLLDEATNALDYEMQQRLISLIKQRFSDIGVLAISHRLDIRSNFDRCYELKQSRLREI